MRAYQLLALVTLTLSLFSCKRETEEFTSEPLSDYLPLQVGDYIIYRLDSTVFTNFGRTKEIHAYHEKTVVDAIVTDALGRPGYRMFRFVRDTTKTQAWAPAGSFIITPTEKTIEFIENNLRFVKMALPVNAGYIWKGNNFLPDRPFGSLYSFNNDLDMYDWDYTYSAKGETEVFNGQTINDVITVDGIDDSFNYPSTDPGVISYVNKQQDKYAKGIGLVYQELTMWEYQPNTSGQGGGFTAGFGVKRSMIEHN